MPWPWAVLGRYIGIAYGEFQSSKYTRTKHSLTSKSFFLAKGSIGRFSRFTLAFTPKQVQKAQFASLKDVLVPCLHIIVDKIIYVHFGTIANSVDMLNKRSYERLSKSD